MRALAQLEARNMRNGGTKSISLRARGRAPASHGAPTTELDPAPEHA